MDARGNIAGVLLRNGQGPGLLSQSGDHLAGGLRRKLDLVAHARHDADPCGPYTLAMAATDHTIRLASSTYARLQAEAARSHRAIDEIAGELLDERLPQPIADREQARSALERLAALRARVGRGVDAVTLVREGREELDRRIPSGE
jgi:hypothetical protein